MPVPAPRPDGMTTADVGRATTFTSPAYRACPPGSSTEASPSSPTASTRPGTGPEPYPPLARPRHHALQGRPLHARAQRLPPEPEASSSTGARPHRHPTPPDHTAHTVCPTRTPLPMPVRSHTLTLRIPALPTIRQPTVPVLGLPPGPGGRGRWVCRMHPCAMYAVHSFRVRSSGVERCSYKADVGGSKPSAPTTTKAPSRSRPGAFGIPDCHPRRQPLGAGGASPEAVGLTRGVPPAGRHSRDRPGRSVSSWAAAP